MHEDDQQARPVYENLDTAFVNLAALLRYLQGGDFAGRVHVELEEYEAEVFLEPGCALRVREINHAAGREAEGEAAMQRLLVRSSEPGGLISVYQSIGEELTDGTPAAVDAPARAGAAHSTEERSSGQGDDEEIAWPELLRLSGDLIAAIERASLSFGADFAALFYDARLEMADDFSYLDPSGQDFHYARGTVQLRARPRLQTYVSSISECLRRVVDRLAAKEHGRSVRERVALELAVLARRRETQIAQLKLLPHLERIAGTRVL